MKTGSYVYEWRGYIDRLFVYTRGRTEAESMASYNNRLSIPFESEPATGMSAYYDMNDIPTGGSGNLVIHNMAFTTTGVGAGVFDIKDSNGSHALEMVNVNFEGCKEIGHYDGYRQGTGITIGFYGCADGMYFSGTQNGFKLTNTNGFGFGPDVIMFREWRDLLFNNRFYLDINVDIPVDGAITDFGPENFNDNRLLQVKNCMVKVGGIVDDPAHTPLMFPNISHTDPKTVFDGNIGLLNGVPSVVTQEIVEYSQANQDNSIRNIEIPRADLPAQYTEEDIANWFTTNGIVIGDKEIISWEVISADT